MVDLGILGDIDVDLVGDIGRFRSIVVWTHVPGSWRRSNTNFLTSRESLIWTDRVGHMTVTM